MTLYTLQNFVTVRKTRGDVIRPAEFRTIVEMILGILKKYNYAGLDADYKLFLAHLIDYNDPHHDANTNFFEEIIERIYAIYTHMVPSPLSLDDFKTDVVPTLGFLELIRRIVLNRYLYDQVMNKDGSVPVSASTILSGDWGYENLPISPTTLNFGQVLPSEDAFIEQGLGSNTSPLTTIFNAADISDMPSVLPVIFAYGSDNPYYFGNSPLGGPIALQLASNDVTVDIQVVNAPTAAFAVLSLSNGSDTVVITLSPDKSIGITLNDIAITSNPIAAFNGQYRLIFSRNGKLVLQTLQAGSDTTETYQMTYVSGSPFTIAMVSLALEDLITQSFALRSLVIRHGYEAEDTNNTILVPPGYALLTDPDGAVLLDQDGTPLMDYDVTVPDGHALLTDTDGSMLIDSDGSFLMDVL